MNNEQHNLPVDTADEKETQDQLIQKLTAENQAMKEKLWVDSSLTRFDDVLRKNYDQPLAVFADAVIFHLAKLTQALRGAFFNLNTDTQLIEAIAGYACTVKTLEQSQFQIGEGLIGQAIKYKETIVLDSIPAHSMVLQASMGRLSGNCIVVIPLIFNQEAYGAMELLYMERIEQKHLDLLDRLGENIASMLNSIQNNIKTRRLLIESKSLEKELRTQEEELRQNMEELNATQEKMQKKEVELSGNLNAINRTISTIEFDMQGNILAANQLFLNLMDYSIQDILNKHHRMFLESDYTQSPEYITFWDDLRNGKTHHAEFKRIGHHGKIVWLKASYTPIKGVDGTPYKVMKLALDITDRKVMEIENLQQLEQVKTAEEEIRQNLEELVSTQEELQKQMKASEKNRKVTQAILETAVDVIVTMNNRGIVQSVNPAVHRLFGYQPEEVIGQNVKILMPEKYATPHDGYLRSYEKTGQKKIIGKGRQVEAQHKDGEVFDAYLSVSEVKLDGGVLYTGFIRSIAELTRTQREVQAQLEQTQASEEEIRQNMEELTSTQEELQKQMKASEKNSKVTQAILETAVDVIMTMNNMGIVQSVNPAIYTLFGYQPEEVIGQNVKILIPHEYISTHDWYLQSFATTAEKKMVDIGQKVGIQHKSGTVIDAYVSVSEIKLDGELLFTGFIRSMPTLQ